MKIRIVKNKKLLLRLAVFLCFVGTAVLLDIYLEKNPADLAGIETESENQTHNPGKICLISPTYLINIKTSLQKSPQKKFQIQSHDKYLRKYHNRRNYQVLKAEIKKQTTPLILEYHYLVFQNHFFSLPDEEPLIG